MTSIGQQPSIPGIVINALEINGRQQLSKDGKAENDIATRDETGLNSNGTYNTTQLKNGLTKAELENIDANKDGLVTENEFKTAMGYDKANEETQDFITNLWGSYATSYQEQLKANNRSVEVRTDAEGNMTGYSAVDKDENGRELKRVTVNGENTSVQVNITSTSRLYTNASVYKFDDAYTVVDDSHKDVREIQAPSAGVNIKGIVYGGSNGIQSITIDGKTYRGNNISKEGNVVTIKDNNGYIVAQATISSDTNETNRLTNIKTGFTKGGVEATSLDIGSDGKITLVSTSVGMDKDPYATNLTASQVNSRLNSASKNLGKIINMFAGDKKISNSAMETLFKELDNRFKNEGTSYIYNINSWVNSNSSLKNLDSDTKTSIINALTAMSQDGTLSTEDFTSYIRAYATLSGNSRNLNATNLTKVANILHNGVRENVNIDNSKSSVTLAKKIMSEFQNLGLKLDDVINIIGHDNGDDFTLGKTSFLTNYNTLNEARQITPEEASKLVYNSQSNLGKILDVFNTSGTKIPDNIKQDFIDEMSTRIAGNSSKFNPSEFVENFCNNHSPKITDEDTIKALKSSCENMGASKKLSRESIGIAALAYTILANDVDGSKLSLKNLQDVIKAISDGGSNVENIVSAISELGISSFDDDSIKNILNASGLSHRMGIGTLFRSSSITQNEIDVAIEYNQSNGLFSSDVANELSKNLKSASDSININTFANNYTEDTDTKNEIKAFLKNISKTGTTVTAKDIGNASISYLLLENGGLSSSEEDFKKVLTIVRSTNSISSIASKIAKLDIPLYYSEAQMKSILTKMFGAEGDTKLDDAERSSYGLEVLKKLNTQD